MNQARSARDPCRPPGQSRTVQDLRSSSSVEELARAPRLGAALTTNG